MVVSAAIPLPGELQFRFAMTLYCRSHITQLARSEMPSANAVTVQAPGTLRAEPAQLAGCIEALAAVR